MLSFYEPSSVRMEKDLRAQAEWLESLARKRDFDSLDEWLREAADEALDAMAIWRMNHPLDA
jgi:hypothetical protein